MILITSGIWLVGLELKRLLEMQGRGVRILSAQKGFANSYLNPSLKIVDEDLILRANHLIHLVGDNIGLKRWSKERKNELYKFRVVSLNFMFKLFRSNAYCLESFISSSAIVFYDFQFDEHVYTENDKAGDDFHGKMANLVTKDSRVSSKNLLLKVFNLNILTYA